MDGGDEWSVVPLQGLPFGAELRGVDLLAWDELTTRSAEADRRRVIAELWAAIVASDGLVVLRGHNNWVRTVVCQSKSAHRSRASKGSARTWGEG